MRKDLIVAFMLRWTVMLAAMFSSCCVSLSYACFHCVSGVSLHGVRICVGMDFAADVGPVQHHGPSAGETKAGVQQRAASIRKNKVLIF